MRCRSARRSPSGRRCAACGDGDDVRLRRRRHAGGMVQRYAQRARTHGGGIARVGLRTVSGAAGGDGSNDAAGARAPMVADGEGPGWPAVAHRRGGRRCGVDQRPEDDFNRAIAFFFFFFFFPLRAGAERFRRLPWPSPEGTPSPRRAWGGPTRRTGCHRERGAVHSATAGASERRADLRARGGTRSGGLAGTCLVRGDTALQSAARESAAGSAHDAPAAAQKPPRHPHARWPTSRRRSRAPPRWQKWNQLGPRSCRRIRTSAGDS